MTRRSQLEVEHLGVNAVEALAVTEGLSVARPMWDDEGIDLIVYSTAADGRLQAEGVQVKAYRHTTWRIDTKYPPGRVMVYVWNATDRSKQRIMALRAGKAREIATKHTRAHNKGGMVYDPRLLSYWTAPAASRDLQELLLPHEIGPSPTTLRNVCGL